MLIVAFGLAPQPSQERQVRLEASPRRRSTGSPVEKPRTSEKPPERERTDGSLRSERTNADREIEERHEALEEDADAVLDRARGRADEVLEVARTKADAIGGDATAATEVQREAEDRTLAKERSEESAQLTGERVARRSALAALLRFEREETDQDLRHEREHSDASLFSRDDFLAMVSHDLKSLLNGIGLSASVLLQETPSDDRGRKVAKRAESIRQVTLRMNRLIGDLLDVTSMEAGQLSVALAANDVMRLIDDSIEAFHPAAVARKLSLSAVQVPGLLLAHFDQERILQVLGNLLSNALKFTGEGGRIELRAERDGEQIRFSVSDTGEGIPAGQLESIFERFQQVKRLDRRGLGLGLYISKCIVESHGGRIWAESTPGKGSTFHFTLNAATEAEPGLASGSQRARI